MKPLTHIELTALAARLGDDTDVDRLFADLHAARKALRVVQGEQAGLWGQLTMAELNVNALCAERDELLHRHPFKPQRKDDPSARCEHESKDGGSSWRCNMFADTSTDDADQHRLTVDRLGEIRAAYLARPRPSTT